MLFDVTIPQFMKTLSNLNALLDKADAYSQAKKFDMNVLLQDRLAPDMFPLMKQIQIACDTAKLCASRLSGKEAPVNDDSEKTLADAKARIQNTIRYLETFTANDFNGAETKHITQPRWEGKYLTGKEYVIHHVLPNIYFHVTTAYAILRHNGVEVGKKDYLGELPFKK
jgi:uncharacterized protein